MPRGTPTGTDTGAFDTASSTAGVMQITAPVLPVPLPATLVATTGSWVSGVILADGYKTVTVGVISTGAGAVTIQRWLDTTGNIPVGTLASSTLVANTANTVSVGIGSNGVIDNSPFIGFTVTITNTSGSTATLTQVSFLMNAS